MLVIKVTGQCHKIPEPKAPEGYVIISKIDISMKEDVTKLKYSPHFLLRNNYEYLIQIINAEGYSTNVEAKLLEDEKLIGTNYNKEQNKIYSDYSFLCRNTKVYLMKVSKIRESEESCGILVLMVKSQNKSVSGNDPGNSYNHDPSIFLIVEKMPRFQDQKRTGITEFQEWVNNQEKVKQVVRESNLTGKAYIQFIVNSEGEVCDVKPSQKRTKPELEAAAVDIVESSPKWISPGTQRGKPVNIRFTVQVDFKAEYKNPD